jgi:hypothetical protein
MLRTACVACLFLALVSAIVARAVAGEKDDTAAPKRNEELRKELQRMVKVDQDAREERARTAPGDAAAITRKVADIDRKNTARMKEIVEKHGWPGRALVGEDGAHAAWLLVQHADKDREFQKHCLELLEKAVKAGDASGADLAYLTDRVLVAESKKQRYGTQFRTTDGKLEPYPIEDEANVDRRRKAVGLSTLAEYRKTLEQVYGAQTKKK